MNIVKYEMARRVLSLINLYAIKPRKEYVNKKVGLVSLVCHDHVDLFIVMVSSFFYQLGFSLPVYVMNDGSLTKEDMSLLKKHFVVSFETPKRAEKKIKSLAKNRRYFLQYRLSQYSTIHKLKFDVLLLNPFSKYIYLDTDLLFFNVPKEISRWIDSKNKVVLYTGKKETSYAIEHVDIHFRAYGEMLYRKLMAKFLGGKIDPLFNSSLICIPNKKIVDVSKLDKIFKILDELSYLYLFPTEELAMSMLFNKDVSVCLPKEKYNNILEPRDYFQINFKKAVSAHYAFVTKKIMYLNALKLVWKTGFFKQTDNY